MMPVSRIKGLVFFPAALMIMLLVLFPPLATTAEAIDSNLLADELMRLSGGKGSVTFNRLTGAARFATLPPDADLVRAGVMADAPPEDVAHGFLAKYGPMFGISDPGRELTVKRKTTNEAGHSFIRYQQVHKGVAVVAGEIIVQVGPARNVGAVMGRLSPFPELDTTPRILPEAAADKALALVSKHYRIERAGLTVSAPELWIYNPALLGLKRNAASLVWRIEVKAVDGLLPVRELVLIDAVRGHIALHFNQVDYAKNRLIYDNNNNNSLGLPGAGPVRTEGGAATGITDVDNAYLFAGDTYDFYWSYHARDSIDGAGMNLISTVRYCDPAETCPYQNAFWNSEQMVYGDGFASADDVVGHELTHGVTEHESNLFYFMQSGAINESFSDVWGEFMDQVNGHGTDTVGVKWQMGEDLPPSIGVIRNMQDPTIYGDPDTIAATRISMIRAGSIPTAG